MLCERKDSSKSKGKMWKWQSFEGNVTEYLVEYVLRGASDYLRGLDGTQERLRDTYSSLLKSLHR